MAGAGEFSKKIGSVEFSSSLGVLTSTGVFMNNGLYQICCWGILINNAVDLDLKLLKSKILNLKTPCESEVDQNESSDGITTP